MGPLTINLRHLATRDQLLEGSIMPNDLGLNDLDPMIRLPGPIEYSLQAQKLNQSLLVQGRLSVRLECECVRCLKAFSLSIDLPGFAVQVPLEGEDACVEGDFVDLTPYVREDIVLAFPQHPLCETGCAGLKKLPPSLDEAQAGPEAQMTSSVWAALNELKL
jgi:uncharacterized metal-binding protein YceD (DUF177 family)